MVQCLKRISIKAPAILAREIARGCPCLSVTVEKGHDEVMSEASRDEVDVVVEYDNTHSMQHWLTWILKLALIVAVVVIVWIIKRG